MNDRAPLDLRAVEADAGVGYCTGAQVATLIAALRKTRRALVAAIVPYVGLQVDRESQRWIAPEIWEAMTIAVKEANAVLASVKDEP